MRTHRDGGGFKNWLIGCVLLLLVPSARMTAAQTFRPTGMATTRPSIFVGLDAQPVGNFDEAAAYGNALHRYDNGPQHNVSLAQWLDAADAKGFYYIVQGAAAQAAGVDLTKRPRLLAVAHDDEPDMAREPSPDRFTAADAPHPSTVGWTRYEVLEARAADWRARWPGVRVSVNFAGASLVNPFYASDLKYHARYIRAADDHGFDYYPANLGGNPYFVPYLVDKLAVTGNPADVYVECSDQALDGDEAGGAKRGPTPAEQGTLVWAALGHGARRLWYFPQRIGKGNRPPFAYLNVQPENKARAVADYALIRRYDDLLGHGVRSLVDQRPKVQGDANKGAVVWPAAETFQWARGRERLTVSVDYARGTAPVIDYVNDTPPPPPADALAELRAAVEQVRADAAAANVRAAAAQASADAANAQLAALRAAVLNAIPPASTQPATQPSR
jgi:hypothetical protein